MSFRNEKLRGEAYHSQVGADHRVEEQLTRFVVDYWNGIRNEGKLDFTQGLEVSGFKKLCKRVEKDFPFRCEGGVSTIGVQLQKVVDNRSGKKNLENDLDCKFPAVILATLLRMLGENYDVTSNYLVYGMGPHVHVKTEVGGESYKVDYQLAGEPPISKVKIEKFGNLDLKILSRDRSQLIPVNLEGLQKLDEMFFISLDGDSDW